MAATSILTRLPTHERRLDNGLRVLVREDHSAPVVSIVTHVSAGYFDEPDALVGISHVLEHMFFKGTERRGVGTIARDTKSAGGYLNAGTIYDRTTYYTTLPADSLEEGLDIQADALRNSIIDADELERELLVIIQEAKRKLDSPSAVATETLFEVMFDVHRMRRWRIGREEGLRRLGRADVVGFYRALYRASNIVLVVAGDVRPEHVFAGVERLYGDMSAGEPVRDPSPAEPQRSGLRLRELTGDVAHAYVEWGWRTPGTLHPDTPLLDLLSVVLGQGRASRLYRGVRERGLVSAVSAHNYTPTEVGVFGVSAEANPSGVPAALRAIRAELLAVAEATPDAVELERAKNILEARLIRRLETTDGQATLLAEWEALGDWRRAGDYIDRALGAEPQDLHRVAREYLGLDLASLVVYRPDGSAPLGLDACALRADLAGVPAAEAPEITAAPEPGSFAATSARGATPAHEMTPARGGAPSEDVVVERLRNGVRVVIAPRRASPLVSIAVVCRGGGVFETAERAGITMLMARASVKGTTTRTAARLAEETEALGATVVPAASADACQWGLSLPSRHFERGLGLLADVVLNPTFPRPELDREREVALRDLARLRDDMYRYPLRLFTQTAYPNHPYGFAVETVEAALHGLGRDDVAEWHRRRVLSSRPWAFVVGDVDVAAALAVVQRELGALPGGDEETPAPPDAWPDGPGERVERRERAQTALLLGFPGPRRQDPDRHALHLLANALTGLGGRFFDELRERRSLAYAVSAYPRVRWLAGEFVAYIATSPEKESETRAALIDGFRRLADEGLDADELARARRYTLGSWRIRGRTNDAQLSRLIDALLFGNGLADIRDFEATIEAIEREEVRIALARRFDPDRIVTGVIRGRASAAPEPALPRAPAAP